MINERNNFEAILSSYVCIQSSQLKLKIQTDDNQAQSQIYLSGLQWYKLFTSNHLAYFFFSRPKYFVVGERYLVS